MKIYLFNLHTHFGGNVMTFAPKRRYVIDKYNKNMIRKLTRKVIKAPVSIKRQIAQEFDVCVATIDSALRFATFGPLSVRIRARTLELGGAEVEDVTFIEE